MSNYIYTIDKFLNGKYDTSKLNREIAASSITIALDHISGSETNVDIFFKAELSNEEIITLDGIIALHDGIDDYIEYTPVSIVNTTVEQPVKLLEEYRDRSGKLRVHQTSRKLGLRIIWAGEGDITSNITKVGGGEAFIYDHKIGGSSVITKYIDYNIAENETFLHEGYITWKDALFDTLSLQMVPRTVTVSGVVGGNKAIYGGYLVVPTAPGSGNIEVTSDLTSPYGGLVYIPTNDLGQSPSNTFWDADYNTTTHKYENVRPNYGGSGRYNMFSYEVVLAEFVRHFNLLSSGFTPLNSSDTDQMGNGMRLKMIATTNTSVGDHDWGVACTMCLHRNKSV